MAKRIAKKKKARSSSSASAPSALLLSRNKTFGRSDLLILLGLAATTLAIYAQVISHQFITLDDPTYVGEENPMVNRGVTLAGVAWAFTTFHAAYWVPLTWIAHMIDSQLFGMFAGGHLLVNALIHVTNTLLVFWFLLRTTRARWTSALVAALFALHPLHVESVAWACERKDTLSTFFGLLSLIAYVRYAEAPSIRRYAWTSVTLALGLMSKPMLVTWPFVMLLLDYWPLGRLGGQGWDQRLRSASHSEAATARALVREKIPLFALAAASAIMTLIAASRGGAVGTLAHEPIALRLSNALVSYATYLLRAFWPNDLAVYYPFPEAGIPAWQIIGAALLLIGTMGFCFFQRKIRPYLIVGWLWFLGTLVPVIGLVQAGGQTMADRFFYIPSIGLFIALVFGLADIARSWRVAPPLSAGIAGGVLLLLASLTNGQIKLWRNSFILFEHTLAVTPPNFLIEQSLGYALGASGRYEEAVAHYEKELQIDPHSYDGLLSIGAIREFQGRLPEAIDYYQAAIRSRSEDPRAHSQLGMALAAQNRTEAALDEMRRASELAPKDPNIGRDFGVVLAQSGKIPEAIDQFHKALRTNPNDAETHANLGLALLYSGKTRESIPEFQEALRLNPSLEKASKHLQEAEARQSGKTIINVRHF
jgi:Tfp pilus assembly protein PilF